MKKFGVALLAVLAGNSAVGANWVKIGISDSGNKVYIDTTSIRKLNPSYPYNSQMITYFAKKHYAQPQKFSNEKYYNYDTIQWKSDCLKNKSSIMEMFLYRNDGSLVASKSSSYDNWLIISPNTVGDTVLNSACQIAGYR